MNQRINRLNRRGFVQWGSGLAAGAIASTSTWNKAFAGICGPSVAGEGPYGPLQEPDENGIRLPVGFRSRVIARSGLPVSGTGYVWHPYPDGGATFAADDGGYAYVSNSEFALLGGASSIRFDSSGNVVDAFRICSGTQLNCAGGKTPWGTWITCEEYWAGYAYECDPFTPNSQIRRAALGRYAHEAAAVDPETGHVFLTEDESDGRLYRFRPNTYGDLSSGTLEVAQVLEDASIVWHRLRTAAPRFPLFNPTRRQVSTSTEFDGGEGIVYHDGCIFFTTKGDNRVWSFDIRQNQLCIVYDVADDPARQLTGVDNIAVSEGGDLFVAEDGGNMELVMLTDGIAAPILRVVGEDESEITGPAFDPSGTRLYFSSQRGGPAELGTTFEVTGPFRR